MKSVLLHRLLCTNWHAWFSVLENQESMILGSDFLGRLHDNQYSCLDAFADVMYL